MPHRAPHDKPNLGERVRDPGFTPSVRDVDALVDLLSDEDLAPAVERAIARAGAPAFARVDARFEASRPPLRGRIVRVLGRLGREACDRGENVEACADRLLSALDDADAKTRRNAAIALAHVPSAGAEAALVLAWNRDPRTEMRRSIAATLGKIGGPGVLDLLRVASRAEDAELARIAGRAAAMIDRTALRNQVPGGRVDATRSAAEPVMVDLLVRSGLEDLLAEELAAIDAVRDVRLEAPGRLGALLVGPPSGLFAARTMLSFRFPLPPEPAEGGVPQAVANALASARGQRVVDAWTEGPARYRIAWADGAHHRAETWRVAQAVSAADERLVNDPTRSTWEVLVSLRGRAVDVAIVPRALDDPRFAWRVGDVPAASHPTIAAALARVGGARPDDVVWDPFVGSGSELVERARLGPLRQLVGSDIDPRALVTARRNLDSARVEARLEHADARSFAPDGVTLIVTNPPMGRRAVREAGLAERLDDFVAHAARILAPGGRLTWIAPWPERSRAVAARAGLELSFARSIDMGGFGAELQRWDKVDRGGPMAERGARDRAAEGVRAGRRRVVVPAPTGRGNESPPGGGRARGASRPERSGPKRGR